MEQPVKKIPGARSGSVYYMCENVPGYYYKLKSKRNDITYLICVEKNCTARASCNESVFLKFKVDEHNHSKASEDVEKAWAVKNQIVHEAESTSTDSRSIYVKHTTRSSVEVGGKLAYPAIVQSMRRQRRKVQPPMPTSLEEFGNICSENIRYGYIDGKKFCRGVIGENGAISVLFLAEEMETLLRNATEIHIDGTFKTRLRHPDTAQLLTVMVIQYGIAFPCCFALMENRKSKTYNALFQTIKNIVPTFNPKLIMSDFELPLVKSIKEIFPNATVNGCFFHYCQAILRQAKVIGMTQFLKENVNSQIALKMIMCLALLPAEDIPTGRARIIIFLEEKRIREEFSTLLSYHKRQWMERVGTHSFSVHNRSRRTNNDCESFHALLERTLRIRSPNVWEFLDSISMLAANSIREIHAFVEEGLEIRAYKKRKYILNNSRIQNATNRYMRDSDIFSFLNAVSSAVNGIVMDNLNFNDVDNNNQYPEEPLLIGLEAGELDNAETNDLQQQEQIEPQDVRNDNTLCIICRQAPPTCIIIPCGHFGLCSDCKVQLLMLQDTPQRPDEEEGYVIDYSICPLDRRPILNLIDVIHV